MAKIKVKIITTYFEDVSIPFLLVHVYSSIIDNSSMQINICKTAQFFGVFSAAKIKVKACLGFPLCVWLLLYQRITEEETRRILAQPISDPGCVCDAGYSGCYFLSYKLAKKVGVARRSAIYTGSLL